MDGNPDITNARYDKHVYFKNTYIMSLYMTVAGDWVCDYVFISDGVIQGDNMKRFCLTKGADFECL